MIRRQMLTALAASAFIPALITAPQLFAATAQMGEVEKKHAEMTMKVGSLSLATSRLAVEMAAADMVKMFAMLEVAEQETVADVLKSMETDKAEGALKVPTQDEVEAMLDATDKETLKKLQSTKGADFDKLYVAAQLDGHKKLLVVQEDYLKVGQNREHLSVAKLARGMIKEHIGHLEALRA